MRFIHPALLFYSFVPKVLYQPRFNSIDNRIGAIAMGCLDSMETNEWADCSGTTIYKTKQTRSLERYCSHPWWWLRGDVQQTNLILALQQKDSRGKDEGWKGDRETVPPHECLQDDEGDDGRVSFRWACREKSGPVFLFIFSNSFVCALLKKIGRYRGWTWPCYELPVKENDASLLSVPSLETKRQ